MTDSIKKWQENLIQDERKYILNFKDNLKALLVDTDGWILRTLNKHKARYKLKTCTRLILVGCGAYPYSLLHVHVHYPEIPLTGIEVDVRNGLTANVLMTKLGLPIEIEIKNGLEYDYSTLAHEDMVFISCDVTQKLDIYKKVLETSKAQPYICLPNRQASS